jgi:hypothetical protein
MTIDEEEKKELIENIHLTFVYRRVFAVCCIILLPILYYSFKVELEIFAQVVAVFLAWILLTFVADFFIKRRKTKKDIQEFYFAFHFLELLLFAVMVNLAGGISWVIPFYGGLFLTYAYIFLPKEKAVFLTFFLILLIGMIALLEYDGFLLHRSYFEFDLSKNKQYFITTFIGFFGFILAVGYNLRIFVHVLEKRTNDLVEAYKETEDVKNSLEIRVRARRDELEHLSKRLDEEVKIKSRKMNQKIKDLQKTNKKIVKRELKMIELKKEIRKLKKELKTEG